MLEYIRENGNPLMGQRLHLCRALSKMGLCSRTEASAWIEKEQVLVNGLVEKDPQRWVELGKDTIVPLFAQASQSIAQVTQNTSNEKIYLALYKPPGYVTTRNDELGRKTVYELLPAEHNQDWIFPIGRLDLESEGLLLFTNDGVFSNHLTEPNHSIIKTYHVQLDKKPLLIDLQKLADGIALEGRKTLPAKYETLQGKWVKVELQEGRNRQIRKSFHELGYKVKRLIRIAIGNVILDELEPGKCRSLTQNEVSTLSINY